jgi:endonuclease/exonuclease/phosphatase family metal-dependent hydrolase
MAGHIRLLQAYAVCHKLDQIRRQDTDEPSPLLICGDFNSDPLSGEFVLRYL